MSGRNDLIQKGFESGGDVNCLGGDSGERTTPLLASLAHNSPINSVAIVELLLDLGADPDKKNDIGSVPICVAAQHKNPEFVRLLLDAGAYINAIGEHGTNALMQTTALQEDNIMVQKLLIDRGCDINYQDNEKRTCIWLAAANGLYSFAELLVNAGADLNCKSTDGTSPLKNAQRYMHYDIEKLLINNGAC